MKNRKKQRRAHSRAVSWVLLVIVLAIGFLAFGTVRGVYGLVENWTSGMSEVVKTGDFNVGRKTRIYAADGTTLLAELYLENREPVTLDQVSPLLIRATIDTEDVRFYQHTGVDPQGIVRALITNLSGKALEGASTITQQFARFTLLADKAGEISLERKLSEAQLAIELEKIYSKDEILLMYLNTINYGDGAYGVEAAARNYFQKHASELELHEAATLAGIPQSPSYLNPKTNPDACLERRNLVLGRMLTAGDITQEEHDLTVAMPLELNPLPEDNSDGIRAYPYFTSYVRDLLNEQYSPSEVFKGGLTVYTTLDPALQDMAQAAADEQNASMADDLEVSLTAVDPKTGYVKAMIGGRDFYTDQYNIATQAHRHAGSSFKVFTLVTALEQGINPSTRIDCSSPATIDDGSAEGWTLENYGGGSYGVQTIQQATAISSNTGYARLIKEVTPTKVVETAQRMGISSSLEPYYSITLGTAEVNTLEMAGAYATLAANGVRREPVAITKIVDSEGTVIFEHEDKPEKVLTDEIAYATTQVLKTVFTGGTAAGAGPTNGQVVAGKTGTSENWRDSWLCGYAPQLSCAVWIGARKERPMPESLNCTYVWRNFMSMALEGQAYEDFPTASNPQYNSPFNAAQEDYYNKLEEEAKKKEEEEKKKQEEADKKKAEAEKKKENDKKDDDKKKPEEDDSEGDASSASSASSSPPSNSS